MCFGTESGAVPSFASTGEEGQKWFDAEIDGGSSLASTGEGEQKRFASESFTADTTMEVAQGDGPPCIIIQFLVECTAAAAAAQSSKKNFDAGSADGEAIGRIGCLCNHGCIFVACFFGGYRRS